MCPPSYKLVINLIKDSEIGNMFTNLAIVPHFVSNMLCLRKRPKQHSLNEAGGGVPRATCLGAGG